VFSKGTSIGSKTLIPFGGQIEPISITGASAAAKKSSKKGKKEHHFGDNKQDHTITKP
jgi:hypothetical protein